MQEREILDALEAVTLNNFSDEDKSVIFAHIINEQKNVRTAKSLNKVVLEKVADFVSGSLKEAQNTSPKTFQDFSEIEAYPGPFEIINKKEIDDYLEKMTSKEWDGDYFDDTFEFYHPKENMSANGVARHRSDFNTSTSNQ